MNEGRVSYAGKRVYIGIDVHRGFFVASCMCEDVVVKRCRMPAKAEAVISLISEYFPQSEVTTCYEAGFSGFWLHRKLAAANISNIIVHPASIEISANNRIKTDKRDSLKIATQLSAGRLRGIRVPTQEQEQCRLVHRTREQFIRARHRVQTQIRMRLHQFGLFPADIKRVIQLKDVEAFLLKMEGDLKFSISCLYEHWKYLASQLKEIEKRLAEQADSDRLDAIYRTLPGIGPLIARTLACELGDMSQFPNERALFSFTGLTPGEYSSGDKIRRGHISRQGSPRLRQMLVQAAWRAVRDDKVLREVFERIATRAGKKRAIVAVARKLIGRTRAVIRVATCSADGSIQAA